MRTRAPALAVVVAFALAVALVATMAGGGGGDGQLVKLPVASPGGAGVADAAASSERSALIAPAYGPVEYRVHGPLPALAATAPAYRLGSTAPVVEVARLAAALGLDGEVGEEDGAWVVRDAARRLRVERLPGLPWSLGTACPEAPVRSDAAVTSGAAADAAVTSEAAADVSCGVAAGGSSGSAGGVAPSAAACDGGTCVSPPVPADLPAPVPVPPGTAVAVDCKAPGAACSAPAVPPPGPPVEEPARPAGLPPRPEAEHLARDAFTRMGVGLDGFAMDDGWSTWEATVRARLDGVPVMGLGAGLGIGTGGTIVHGYGFLALPERIGEYPLVGTDAGLRRLREGSGPGPRPLGAVADPAVGQIPQGAEPAVDLPAPDQGGAAAPCPPACDVPQPAVAVDGCPETAACDVFPPPTPVVHTVTGAHLVLVHLDAVLVPAYVFELEGGDESPPVPAVTDEWLEREAPARRR